jgi:hypothetical protein
MKKAIQCFNQLHSEEYSNIFSDFGQKEFVIEKLANISKLDDGFVLLGEDSGVEKVRSTNVQRYSSTKNIVEDYIPDKGRPKPRASETFQSAYESI